MAGMLPGVECARRRRFHQSSDSAAAVYGGSSRRTSFCLYTSNHEVSHSAISSLRNILNKEFENEKLGATARQAKERLDERLRIQKRKSASRRHESSGSVNMRGREGNGRSAGVGGELQTEIYGSRRSGSKRFNWAKLSWKASEQDECTICLERFKPGETLVQLPCAHRFHCRCLVPWLENNAHCPCCRMDIYVEFS